MTLFYGSNVGAPPTFQSLTTNTQANALLNIVDDFIGVNIHGVSSGDSIISAFSWKEPTNNDWLIAGLAAAGHPGVIGNPSFSTQDRGIFLTDYQFVIAPQFVLGGGTITLNFVIKIATLSNVTNRYTLRVGFGDTSNADQANGVYFEYSDNINSGNWVYKSASSSVLTTSNSTTAVTTGWHNLQIIVNSTATSVSYYVDGVLLGSAITTNIPTATITPFVDIVWSAGTIAANSIQVDLFTLNQVFTTAR